MAQTKFKYRWFVFPLFALITYLSTLILNNNRQLTEKFYSAGIYPKIAANISKLSSFFSFSLDDVFYTFLIIIFIYLLLFLIIKKIKFVRFVLLLVNSLAVVYILFYWLWGFNYFRPNVNTRIGLSEHSQNNEAFEKSFKYIIHQTNASQCSFDDFNKHVIDSLVENAYKHSAPALNINYPQGKRRAKNISLSSFFAQAGISGYYGPFFSEVHVNSKVLPVEYPFVLAHEKAHQFGITSEAEANFYAWVVCSQSNSKPLKYSANLAILRHFIFQGFGSENYKNIVALIDQPVKTDFNKIQKHWQNLRNEKVDKVASHVNDTYLKTNKIEQGINDYHGVVKLVSDYLNDSTFREKNGLKPSTFQ